MTAGRRGALGAVILVMLGVGAVVLLFIIASTSYDLVVGHSIPGRIVSCAYRSCTVAWQDGAAHGTSSIDGLGHRPGDVITVVYVSGRGVTNRSGDLVALVVLVGFFVLIGWLVWRAKRRPPRIEPQ